MPTKKETPSSQYDLFRGKLTFTNEPLWFRLVLCVLILAGAVALVLMIRQYVFPTLAIRWLSGIKVPAWLKVGNIRSP